MVDKVNAYVHKHETRPLQPDLRNPQHRRRTSSPGDFFTALDILSTRREDQYIANRCNGGQSAEQDPPWRQTLRRAAGDDFDVLWEVGYQDTDNDDGGQGDGVGVWVVEVVTSVRSCCECRGETGWSGHSGGLAATVYVMRFTSLSSMEQSNVVVVVWRIECGNAGGAGVDDVGVDEA